MQGLWPRFKSFWTAEEIPRWLGLSLVGVLLFGLGAVAYLSVQDTRRRLSSEVQRNQQAALDLLATTLASVDPHNAMAQQRIIRSFAFGEECENLRVVGAGNMVIASISLEEIGQPRLADRELGSAPPERTELRVLQSPNRHLERRAFRVPIPVLASGGVGSGPPSPDGSAGKSPFASGGDDESERPFRYVEGVMLARLDAGVGVATLSNGIIVLSVVGMFFVLYRLMRRHFRSMVQISENLVARGDQIEHDLQQLRLTEVENSLAVQWNRLIDTVGELQTAQRRSSASDELTQALERSQRGELADVVDMIPHGVLHVVDQPGEASLAYANPAAQRLLGITLEAGQRIRLDQVQPGLTGQKIFEQILQAAAPESAGGAQSTTATVADGDGKTTYRVRVLPFNKKARRGECVVMISDISQQVRAERASGEFVSQVTHELRTPLTNIRAYAETLSSGVLDDPKVVSECYNVITKETRRLGRLIEDILSMSQLEVGTLRLHIDDVDLRTLLTDAVRDVRQLADEKGIDVQVSLPSKLPIIQADRDKLAVVVNNLLGNALKYSKSGGSVRVGCQMTPDEILITVKDDGIGIDPADHERIFEKFQRGSAPEVSEIEGAGIGLTTAREITRQHGGDIEVMSAPGQGATFIVHVPVIEARRNGESQKAKGERQKGTQGKAEPTEVAK